MPMKWDPLGGKAPSVFRQPRPKIKMPVRENPPGWREVGMFFTLVDDAVYPKDKNVTRALLEHDPGIIPAWCKWVFQAPMDESGHHETVVFGRHAILRYKWNPWIEHTYLDVEVPHGYTGPRPNIVERIFDYGGRGRDDRYSDLPGPFEPWDWHIYYQLLQDDNHNDAQQMLDRSEKAKWRASFNKRHLREEWEYMQQDFQRWAQPYLDTLSDVEIKEYMLGGWKARKAPKPMVFLSQ